MEDSRGFVHIGLPKTGTSSIQRVLKALLRSDSGTHYNCKEVLDPIRIATQVSVRDEMEGQARQAFQTNKHVISAEDLVGWDPRFWESRADLNAHVFGAETPVLISVRDPFDMLRSYYLQRIQEGHVVNAEQFFVPVVGDGQDYETRSSGDLQFFPVASFDLNRLEFLYRRRFEKVVFGYPEDIVKEAVRLLAVRPDNVLENVSFRENKSLSSVALFLTLRREKILGFFGLRSIDRRQAGLSRVSQHSRSRSCSCSRDNKSDKPLILRGRDWFFRLLKNFLDWRWWMQTVVSRVFSDPARVDFLEKHFQSEIRENRRWLNRLILAQGKDPVGSGPRNP